MMKDPTDLTGQAEEAAQRAETDADRRRQEVDDFKQLMDTASGRRFVWRLLSITGVYRTSMTGNSSTFFNEGRRDVGLQLLAEIHEHSIDAFVQMLKEQKANE